jgi:hypothetical protein
MALNLMDDARLPVSSRKVEAYKAAAAKKKRNYYGLLAGCFFIGFGFLINEIIVFGGILVTGISLLNLYASLYAEKQLRIIGKEADAPPASMPVKASTNFETKECTHCKKRIPVTDKFCGECGKKVAE